MSPEVLNFLAMLLSQVQVSASAADFDDQCAIVSRARTEMLAALAAAAPVASNDESGT